MIKTIWLARHSTITLTMDRYFRVALASERKALEVLPEIVQIGETALLKTGTDDMPVESHQKNWRKNGSNYLL